jgi:hypothetical protein
MNPMEWITQAGTAGKAVFPRCSSFFLNCAIAGLLLVQLLTPSAPGAAAPPDLPKADIIRLGEQMYRQGILPSGAPMPAFIRGDVEVDSSAFSCSSCHLRAGLGSFEGGVLTPPTTGARLYQPYRRPPSQVDIQDQTKRSIYANTVLERPAYTRESLATALRFGSDPAGQAFNDVMPRYPLSDDDMSILIRYLEELSAQPSPGASSREFRFATIISDDVSPEDRQALLKPLRSFVARKNQQMKMYTDFKKFGYIPTVDMKNAFRQASLDVWELKGPPETWPGQLAAYYSANPVFAVLGGISNQDWRPVHDFCEARRLPCLFPITDFPVISDTAWYTLYFNKGYYQEGEGAALYLNRREGLPSGGRILQIVQDTPAGKALAAGFQETWKNLGHPPVTSLVLGTARLLDRESLSKLLTEHQAGTLLLWTGADLLPELPQLIDRLAAPGMVLVSSGYLGARTATIAEAVRDRVYITFPYRLTPYAGPKTGGYDSRVPILTSARDFGDRRIASRSTTVLQQSILQVLNLIYDNLYRDHLLDILSMQMDLTVRDYERFSFGPGQRYASKGCYIIQLGPGKDPALLPRSEWVMH